MAEGGDEQNKSEEATPFKLRRAREKGSVARGTDLGFFTGLVGLGVFLSVAGATTLVRLTQMMGAAWRSGIPQAGEPQAALRVIGASYWTALYPLLLFGGTMLVVVLACEILQMRGIVFTAHPLKPDFSRVNPAKGLKRMFSLRMLKEALKNSVKMALYVTVAVLVTRAAITKSGPGIVDALTLSDAVRGAGIRLLWTFAALALFVAALDQLLVRGEFRKQMRMSRREVTRESREREGDPRLKNKRKQLHGEFAKRNAGMNAVAGSDMLVVNPQHVAIALLYDRGADAAPVVRAKARDRHALAMRRQAVRHDVPVLESPALARALYAECEPGDPIGAQHYTAVAGLYFKLHAMAADRG